MSQLAASDGQPDNWEEPDFSPRLLEPVRVQTYGWQEPCESRDSRTVLWERGGFPFATRLWIPIQRANYCSTLLIIKSVEQ